MIVSCVTIRPIGDLGPLVAVPGWGRGRGRGRSGLGRDVCGSLSLGGIVVPVRHGWVEARLVDFGDTCQGAHMKNIRSRGERVSIAWSGVRGRGTVRVRGGGRSCGVRGDGGVRGDRGREGLGGRVGADRKFVTAPNLERKSWSKFRKKEPPLRSTLEPCAVSRKPKCSRGSI